MSYLQVETELGTFKIDLQVQQAPATCAYFADVAAQGHLDSGVVFRIVNGFNDAVSGADSIDVVQIGTSNGLNETRDAISHEPTSLTGLRHCKWSVSAARYEPGSVYKSFFICMSDLPQLDAGGNRHPDNQGFAVFGYVSDGHSIASRLFASAGSDEYLADPISILSVSYCSESSTQNTRAV